MYQENGFENHISFNEQVMSEQNHIRQLSEIGFSSCEIEKLRKAMPVFRAMLAADTAEQPEPPPVEIPRRVVGLNSWALATVVGELRDHWIVAVDGFNGITRWRKDESKEINLRPAEQCRLLLEKMSRENLENDSEPPERRTRHWLTAEGKAEFTSWENKHPFGAPVFSSHENTLAARGAVIRAGLAPEEWEVSNVPT